MARFWPSGPRWRARWCAALLVLAAAAAGLLVVGLVDLISADGIAANLVGGTLAALAGLILVAVGRAWPGRWQDQSTPGVVAAVALLLVSLWFGGSVLAWGSWGQTPAFVVAALVAVAAMVVLWLALAVNRRGDRRRPADNGSRDEIRRGEKLGAPATVGAAVLALPLAWYSTQYLPAHTLPTVTITMSIGEATAYRDGATAPIVITVQNVGRTDVRVVGSLYVVAGVTVARLPVLPAGVDRSRLDAMTARDYGPGARYSTETAMSAPQLLQFGQVVWDQSTLVPGETTTATLVAFLPAGKFDVLRGGVDIVLARDDRMPTEPAGPATEPMGTMQSCGDTRMVVRRWPLERGSLVERLTRQRHEVVRGLVVDDPLTSRTWWPPVPYLVYQVQRTGQPCGDLFDPTGRLEKTTMADQAGAMTEVVLPPEVARRQP